MYQFTNLIIEKFEFGGKSVIGDSPFIVKTSPPGSHFIEHISTDGRIMNVTSNLTTSQIFEQWQRKSIAHCVKIHIWNAFF